MTKMFFCKNMAKDQNVEIYMRFIRKKMAKDQNVEICIICDFRYNYGKIPKCRNIYAIFSINMAKDQNIEILCDFKYKYSISDTSNE